MEKYLSFDFQTKKNRFPNLEFYSDINFKSQVMDVSFINYFLIRNPTVICWTGEEKNTENRADEEKKENFHSFISAKFSNIFSKLYNLSLKSTLGFTSVSKDFQIRTFILLLRKDFYSELSSSLTFINFLKAKN